MTDLAGAMAPTENLPAFDGRPVVRTTLKVTKAGDGLSPALQLDPQVFRIGQRVTLILDGVISDVDHRVAKGYDATEDDAPLQRLHTFETESAMVIDRGAVADALDAQAEKIRLAREQAEGIQRLPAPGEDGWSDEDAGIGNGGLVLLDEPDAVICTTCAHDLDDHDGDGACETEGCECVEFTGDGPVDDTELDTGD